MKTTMAFIILGLLYGAYRIWYGYDHPLGWIIGIGFAIITGVVVGVKINKLVYEYVPPGEV